MSHLKRCSGETSGPSTCAQPAQPMAAPRFCQGLRFSKKSGGARHAAGSRTGGRPTDRAAAEFTRAIPRGTREAGKGGEHGPCQTVPGPCVTIVVRLLHFKSFLRGGRGRVRTRAGDSLARSHAVETLARWFRCWLAGAVVGRETSGRT
jgi:hypothetical protein